MPAEQQYLFLSVDGSTQATPTASVRKQQRSWITRIQHSRRRDRKREEKTCSAAAATSEKVAATTSRALELDPEAHTESPTPPTPTSESWARIDLELPASEVKAKTRRRSDQYTAHQSTSLWAPSDIENANRAISPGTDCSALLLSKALRDPTDTLQVYARELQIPAILLWTDYLYQERQHGRLFKSSFPQFGDNRAPRVLHPLILSNPAMVRSLNHVPRCRYRW